MNVVHRTTQLEFTTAYFPDILAPPDDFVWVVVPDDGQNPAELKLSEAIITGVARNIGFTAEYSDRYQGWILQKG